MLEHMVEACVKQGLKKTALDPKPQAPGSRPNSVISLRSGDLEQVIASGLDFLLYINGKLELKIEGNDPRPCSSNQHFSLQGGT